jgi:hypothetical protein
MKCKNPVNPGNNLVQELLPEENQKYIRIDADTKATDAHQEINR